MWDKSHSANEILSTNEIYSAFIVCQTLLWGEDTVGKMGTVSTLIKSIFS